MNFQWVGRAIAAILFLRALNGLMLVFVMTIGPISMSDVMPQLQQVKLRTIVNLRAKIVVGTYFTNSKTMSYS